MSDFDPSAGLDEIFSGTKTPSGSGKSPTATPTPRQWQPFSMSQLRQYYRAGALTYEAWVAELMARGGTRDSVVGDIATEVTKGLSTAKNAAPGALSPAEQRAVDALIALIPAATATPTPTATPAPGAPPPAPTQPMGMSGEFSYNDELAAYAAQHGGQLPPTATGGGGAAPPPAAAAPSLGGRGGTGGGAPGGAAAQQAAPPPPPPIWQYFRDAEGNPYVLITETGKTHKLPKGTKENSVTAVYEAMRHLPENSPNFGAIMQAFEQTKQTQGEDEFGRPYYDAGTQASTRYSAAPLPEKLPGYMQQELIGGLVDEEKYAKRGLNLDLFPQAEFVRSRAGDNLWIDYDDQIAGNELEGPVLGPRGGVFADVGEAENAAWRYGREDASMETQRQILAQEKRKPYEHLDENYNVIKNQPLKFAEGGEMELRRPASVVDQRTGQVIAEAAMNGPERMSFGGEHTARRPLQIGISREQHRYEQLRQEMRERYERERNQWQRQYSGMTPTNNPRLVAENPKRYYLDNFPSFHNPRVGLDPMPPPEMAQPYAPRQGESFRSHMPGGPGRTHQPLNFMDQQPLASTPVQRTTQRQPRPVYDPSKMLKMMSA